MPAPLSSLPASTASGPAHLRVDGISRSFPDRRVLTDVSLVVSSGERACLIGENGSGKSTLLRIIAGLDRPDTGTVQVPGTVGLHHQEPPFDPRLSITQVLAEATAPLRALAARVEAEAAALADEDPGAGARLDAALESARRHRAWDTEHRTDRLVQGLGLTSVPRDRPVADLSGGQRSRLSLAWMLLRSPDTLLLDEPTNHLDDEGTELLVELLRGWAGPVLLASHDRAFLDEAGTTLLDLDPAPMPRAGIGGDTDADSPGSGFGLTRFTGSYSAYLQQRRDDRRRWVHRYREEQEELHRLRTRVRTDQQVGHADRAPRTEARASRKFYSDRNATVVARRVNDAATALERLEAAQVRQPPARLRFRGPPGSVGRTIPPGPVLTADRIGVHGRLGEVSLTVSRRTRLLVTGANGSGKSTLLEVLAGAGRGLPTGTAAGGVLTVAPGVRVGLLSQEPLPRPSARSVRQEYAVAVGQEQASRHPLADHGLLAERDLDRRVGDLSVGQRRRLDLAVILADPPDVLLLDEPTNHLSLLLVSELELSLPDYPGAVVVASHDRWLREDWHGERLHLPEGTLG
ncbi:ABC-F family ATP-binding cassette domain-containing protein [Serinicoccus sp. LYQ131]|uniref:ABC-F family ATP-binding cassette domain-containing protein n=1 Tax=Serinicoccus sp. LYQ131 TaxID=3378797 RepID=UPI003853C204